MSTAGGNGKGKEKGRSKVDSSFEFLLGYLIVGCCFIITGFVTGWGETIFGLVGVALTFRVCYLVHRESISRGTSTNQDEGERKRENEKG